MDVAIIGAGIAGLSCADMLAGQGARVRLFDKARGPGGRMASRRIDTPLGTAGFDHGAQYVTVRGAPFRAQMLRWAEAGVAARWPEAGADAWVGTPAMNAIPKHMARPHDVTLETHVHGIARRPDGWHLVHQGGGSGPFEAVVVALPAEQAATMLGLQDLAMARTAVETRSEPCWALMAVFDRAIDAPPVLRERGPIIWAARNNAKPGRTGPEAWTVQAGPEWSRTQLEADPATIAPALLALFAQAAGCTLPEPVALTAHRWRFALSGSAGRRALWDEALALGACGDWLFGPRVELAWLSGRRLAEQIIGGERLAALAPPMPARAGSR